jgi:very-short-patch-repair endonuclease
VFRRQHPIGPYVLDFYCPAARLAIEIDGVLTTWQIGPSAMRAVTTGSKPTA